MLNVNHNENINAKYAYVCVSSAFWLSKRKKQFFGEHFDKLCGNIIDWHAQINEQKPVRCSKSRLVGWFDVTEFKGSIFIITRHIIIHNRCLCLSISFHLYIQKRPHENILEHTIVRLKIWNMHLGTFKAKWIHNACAPFYTWKIPNCILFGQMQRKCFTKNDTSNWRHLFCVFLFPAFQFHSYIFVK